MLELILLIFIGGVVVFLGVLFFRSLNRLTFYEDQYDDIYGRLLSFSQTLDNVLEKEIYSSDPVIQDLVEQMQEIQWFMSQLQENYRFNSLAENTEDESA
jgi:predicted PurR-regulated permease PerM|tara:strand:+ start:1972 stop:2271 length:300 start_codon:yes stop_codon:yes gene_type:complete